MTDQEIKNEVMRRYPKTEKEKRGCSYEIDRMRALRLLYEQRLKKENSGITGKEDEVL